MSKQVLLRRQANLDVMDAVRFYAEQNEPIAASGFIENLQDSYNLISQYPTLGALRYAQELAIPHLRSWPLSRYPYVILYLERLEHIDVWRVLHQHRDIPTYLHTDCESQ